MKSRLLHLDANYSATTDDPVAQITIWANEGIADDFCEFGNLQPHSAQYGSSVLSAIEQGKLMVTQSPGEYELIGLSDFNQTMKQRVQENAFELGFSYLNELITDPRLPLRPRTMAFCWGITWTDHENASSGNPLHNGLDVLSNS